MMSKQPNIKPLRRPVILFLVLIGMVALYVLKSEPEQMVGHGWLFAGSAISIFWQEQIIVGGVLAEIALIWFGQWLFDRHPWALFGPQLIFAVTTSIGLEHKMPILAVGVITVVAIEIINFYARPQKPLIALGVLSLLILGAYAAYNGILQAVIVLIAFLFVLFVVVFYSRYYFQQAAQRQQAEDLLAEVQLAYDQVEASTIRTERQRVARELHDTLTQGLAGTVMQLEAAESFLQNGQVDRGTQVVHDATDIARDTLRQSRLTLSDLRATTEQSLQPRLELLVDAFKKNYHLETTLRLHYVPDFSDAQLTQITRIVSEAMMNVVKHTDTLQVVINGDTQDSIFTLSVIDFGSGRPLKSKSGHFGVTGMHERAAVLDGALTVVGTPGEGTTVTLTMPTVKKEHLHDQSVDR